VRRYFAAQVERLANQPVTDAQWTRFLGVYCGTGDAKASKRATTSPRYAARLEPSGTPSD
jgi:hypothetical protein